MHDKIRRTHGSTRNESVMKACDSGRSNESRLAAKACQKYSHFLPPSHLLTNSSIKVMSNTVQISPAIEAVDVLEQQPLHCP